MLLGKRKAPRVKGSRSTMYFTLTAYCNTYQIPVIQGSLTCATPKSLATPWPAYYHDIPNTSHPALTPFIPYISTRSQAPIPYSTLYIIAQRYCTCLTGCFGFILGLLINSPLLLTAKSQPGAIWLGPATPHRKPSTTLPTMRSCATTQHARISLSSAQSPNWMLKTNHHIHPPCRTSDKTSVRRGLSPIGILGG